MAAVLLCIEEKLLLLCASTVEIGPLASCIADGRDTIPSLPVCLDNVDGDAGRLTLFVRSRRTLGGNAMTSEVLLRVGRSICAK